MPIPLETERLLIRPYREGDAVGLHDLFNSAEVMRWTPSPPSKDLAETAQRLGRTMAFTARQPPGLGLWALELRANGDFLGQVGLFPVEGKGPEVEIFLEIATESGKAKRIPIEEAMIDTKSGKPVPRLKWHFTGSALKQPDPEKDDKVYGADLTGTLITVFPVTDDCVVQSGLAFKDQDKLKLEVNKKLVPKEGTPLKLVIKVK